MWNLKGKRVVITGATGTVGKAIIESMLSSEGSPSEIIGIDNHEQGVFDADLHSPNINKLRYKCVDIRDYNALKTCFNNVTAVIHCAAMKHVSVCESAPDQAVATNIVGTQNIIEAAKVSSVERVLFTSSDKAVNPTNVMGTSKLMGERLITAANSGSTFTKFSSTRFGNVIGSSGSVLPIFFNQIAAGSPVTLTHKDMTRFIMTEAQAAALVLDSLEMMRGGEVFVTKMPVANIQNLAFALWELTNEIGLAKNDSLVIKEIGIKPGEKLFEELMTEEEMKRSVELDSFFAVLPAFRGFFKQTQYNYKRVIREGVDNPYNSSKEPQMTINEIKDFLRIHNVLNKLSVGVAVSRRWPGD
ncbi:polysaccharide biosynthesis protein [Gammaproteobacteria bacterium]|nr:polysaccharide biosynthesis protein [Gammaproteobacteria bacterium]